MRIYGLGCRVGKLRVVAFVETGTVKAYGFASRLFGHLGFRGEVRLQTL